MVKFENGSSFRTFWQNRQLTISRTKNQKIGSCILQSSFGPYFSSPLFLSSSLNFPLRSAPLFVSSPSLRSFPVSFTLSKPCHSLNVRSFLLPTELGVPCHMKRISLYQYSIYGTAGIALRMNVPDVDGDQGGGFNDRAAAVSAGTEKACFPSSVVDLLRNLRWGCKYNLPDSASRSTFAICPNPNSNLHAASVSTCFC